MSKELKTHDMKLVRHMTLGEYTELVVPKIIELKKILRKKHLMSVGYYGLKHISYDEYMTNGIEKYKSSKYYLESEMDSEIESLTGGWVRSKLKPESTPTELLEAYENIFEEIAPLFMKHENVELTKAHKDHKAEIRKAISDDTYVKELKSGVITYIELEAICDSVGVRIPKRVADLKEKVASGMYERGYVKANGKFLASVREFLTPYIGQLQAMKREQLMHWVDMTESQSKSAYRFWALEKNSESVYSEISRLFEPSGNVRVSDFNKRITEMAEYYAESYVQTFIGRLENKTNIVNLNWGIPTIEFTSECEFSSGQLNVGFTLTYENGQEIHGSSKVITAGGYIQCLHQRYLFHFWHNASQVTLEQMDELTI